MALVTGVAPTDLVGALKEAFGKKKEFVPVDLDTELAKLGLKQFVPLELWSSAWRCSCVYKCAPAES